MGSGFEISYLEKKQDERGFLVEFLKQGELLLKQREIDAPDKEFKQIYLATLVPKAVRGNHYHKEKSEWITFINGKAEVRLEDIDTKKRKKIIVDSADGNRLIRVLLKPNTAHAFKNLSKSTVVLIAYANKVYDSANPDTYDYKVL